MTTRAVVEEFDRALSREVHHLVRWPELLSQQVLNVLQFADPPISVAQEALEVQTTAPKRPWIRRRNRLRQAESLMFVLETGFPTSCVIGASGDFIAAGVADGTLTVWDAETGQQRTSFPLISGDSELKLVGTTPRGDVICLEDHASAFRFRDPTTSQIRADLRHSTWDVRACAVTELRSFVLLESNGDELRAWTEDGMAWTEREGAPIRVAGLDDRLVVSATSDGAVTVREVHWKTYSTDPAVAGAARWRAPPRAAPVVGTSVRDDLRAVVLAYEDGTVWIGDASTGQQHGTLDAGTREITSCALGPDFVVIGAADGTVRVLDLRTLRSRFIAKAHEGAVTGCAMSRDGSLVVAGGPDGGLTMLDATTGLARGSFAASSGDAIACGVSYDGEAVLAATDAGCVEAWWHEPGSKWFLWAGPYAVQASATSLTGDLLAAVTADGVLRIWDTSSQAERAFPIEGGMSATCCAISPAGDLVVVGCEDGSLRLEDSDVRVELARRAAHPEQVQCCAFGPDGSFVVSGGKEGMLKRWSAPDLEEQFAVEAHRFGVKSCAVGPDGRSVVSGSDDGSFGEPARIWDASTGAEIATLEGQDDRYVSACVVSPDASFVVTAGWGGNALRVWRAERTDRGGPDAEARGGAVCAFHPDGEVVLTGWHKKLAIADARTGEKRFDLEGISDDVLAGAASPDGDFFVAGGWGGAVHVWDAHTGERRTTLSPTIGVRGSRTPVCMQIAVSSASDLVLSVDEGISIWNLRTGEEWLLDRGGAFHVTPDGGAVASPGGGEIAFLDIRTGERLRAIPGGGAFLPMPDWSALVWYADGTVEVWDPDTREKLGSVSVHEERMGKREAKGAAISPDGRYVVTGGTDRTIRVTRLDVLETIMTIPVLSEVVSVAVHPWLPVIACGDFTYNLHLLELVGVEYGPVVVTPLDDGDGPAVRCPKCWRRSPIEPGLAGEVIECPTSGCDLRLRITQFVARPFSGSPAPELQTGERMPPEPSGLAGALSRLMDERNAQEGTDGRRSD